MILWKDQAKFATLFQEQLGKEDRKYRSTIGHWYMQMVTAAMKLKDDYSLEGKL